MKITTGRSARSIRGSVAAAVCLSLAGPSLAAQQGSSRFINPTAQQGSSGFATPAAQQGSSIKAQEGSSRFITPAAQQGSSGFATPAAQQGSSIKAQEGSSRFINPAAQEGSSRLQSFLQTGANLMHIFAQQGSSKVSTPALTQASRASGMAGSSSSTKQSDACEMHQIAVVLSPQETC
jgi:hypothetical protein